MSNNELGLALVVMEVHGIALGFLLRWLVTTPWPKRNR